MEKKTNYIIREVPPEQTDFSLYFEDDGLTSAGGDYCYNLFIVAQSRNSGGFNEKEYQNIQNEIENLLEMYSDIVGKSNYAQYPSIGAMLKDYKLIDNIHNTKRIKAFTSFFADCNTILGAPYTGREKFEAHNTDMTAEYLTLKTGKEWDTVSAYGYCQGDQVVVVYCKEHYTDGAKQYGEVWLGAAKEFYTIDIDENGEETDTCGGYIIADCQARTDEGYKKLVCEWADIPEEETQLEMVDGSRTYTKYNYRTA